MKFTYKARTKEGKIRGGTVEASSRKDALDVLNKYGLFVTLLKEEGPKSVLKREIAFLTKVSSKDVVIFTRQFGIMLQSAIPPLEALRALVTQVENPTFREKIVKMAEALETGSSLSRVFSMHPEIFDPFFVSIIKAGEATGMVADSLGYLADHLERDYTFKQQVRGAMLYPIFVIMVFMATFFLATFFIIPRLTTILKEFGAELPLLTRIIVFIADLIRQGGWLFIIAMILFLLVFPKYSKRSPKLREAYEKITLKTPLIGDLRKKIFLTRFAENLSVLISAGLPITQALKIIKDIIGASIYKAILQETEERVGRGEKISSILIEYPEQFTPFLTQMIATGEEAGKIEESLSGVVRFYRQEIERTTKKLMTIMEPVLIIILAMGVAVLVFAVFMPLFSVGLGGGI